MQSKLEKKEKKTQLGRYCIPGAAGEMPLISLRFIGGVMTTQSKGKKNL
jgi:hypothetical protein